MTNVNNAAAVLYRLTEWLLQPDERGERYGDRVRHYVINCSDQNPQNYDFCPRCVILWARKSAEDSCPEIKGNHLSQDSSNGGK